MRAKPQAILPDVDKICDTLGKPLNADVDPNLYVCVLRTSGKRGADEHTTDRLTVIHAFSNANTHYCVMVSDPKHVSAQVYQSGFFSGSIPVQLKSLLRLSGQGLPRKKGLQKEEKKCHTKKGIINRSTWFSNRLLMCRYRTSASYLGENEKVRFH